jgi:phosphomannomutase
LAVAEKVNGTWTPFTGNEIGAMLGHWMWENWRKKNPSANAGDVYVVASTVSSKA